ncbi:MAG: TIGR02452 family protein [Syntrophobacteraceae bacterium]
MNTFNTQISRELAAEYGRQAVQITESGEYRAPSGGVVNISHLVKRSINGTVSYPPGQPFQESARGNYQTKISVENTTTLDTARRLIAEGHRPAVLNFASATNPGGGFLGGARAQEEYLARSSGLYACIRDNAMYAFHRSRRDPLYTNYAIYSPDVPVFRQDDGSLLDAPYTVAIITCPAVNASKIVPERSSETGPAMWLRILKVLSIGVKHSHDSIVLGAWGCGAFGNDGSEIAALFHRALEQNFMGSYRQVIFAIVDWSRDRKFIGPFQKAFTVN